MIQWVGLALALISFAYNGFKDYQNGVIKVAPLTNQNQTVESTKQQPIRYYQAVYDAATGKFHVLGTDGVWYEQVPVIQNQTQRSSPVGTPQGTQQPSLGQRDARFSPQAAANPWLR